MPSFAQLWQRADTSSSSDNGGLGEDVGDGQYTGSDVYDEGDYSWWWSPTGMAVRYTIIILIFASIVIFFLGGYYHAQRRIRKGLPPLPYHAWMVRRSYRQQPQYNYNPYYQQQSGPHQQQGYAMQENEPPLPPPPYTAPPPAYAPPAGASKAMADQTFHPVQRSGESSLPPLPPAARQ